MLVADRMALPGLSSCSFQFITEQGFVGSPVLLIEPLYLPTLTQQISPPNCLFSAFYSLIITDSVLFPAHRTSNSDTVIRTHLRHL